MIKLNRLFEVIDFKEKQIESGDHLALSDRRLESNRRRSRRQPRPTKREPRRDNEAVAADDRVCLILARSSSRMSNHNSEQNDARRENRQRPEKPQTVEANQE
jgi:hypothetical protein